MQGNIMYNPIGGIPIVNNLLNQGQQMIGKFTSDPFFGMQSMTISQNPDWVECICPCIGEKRNVYNISSTNPTGVAMVMPVGRVEEFSQCPSRFFCQCWRSFDLSFITPQGAILFTAMRKYKIPSVFCMPCERPELTVFVESNLIGYVKQPWMCCGRSECPVPLLAEMDICDASGNTKYYISGEFIQCGNVIRYCAMPRCCGPCQNIVFDIYNPMKQKVGQIRNAYNGCCEEYCSKADRFIIDFPQGCSFEDKCLFIMAVINIDYDTFEYTFCNFP